MEAMTRKRAEVWSTYRKLMANLVPALAFVPVFAIGLMLYQRGQHTAALAFLIASPIVGLVAVNFLGLYQNSQMKLELRGLLGKEDAEPIFVGFSRPGSISALDPHDDLGWLVVGTRSVKFFGEKGAYDLPWSDIRAVRFRPNVHTLLGLGRWISFEGLKDGKQLRMMVEPRVHSTLLANKREGARLLRKLRALIPPTASNI